VALLGYWVSLFIATHWPNNLPILGGGQADKVVHFAAFGLLAFLLAAATQTRGLRQTRGTLVLLWSVVALYGMADELLQTPVGRSCEFYDWLADAIGAAIGLAVFRWLLAEKLSPCRVR